METFWSIVNMTLYLVFAFLPFVIAVWLIVKKRKGMKIWVVAWILSSVIGYVSVVGGTMALAREYRVALEKFDVDHDGGLSSEENTLEAQKAMKRMYSDTGRSFVPIVYLVFSPIYSCVCFLIVCFVNFVRYLFVKNPKEDD